MWVREVIYSGVRKAKSVLAWGKPSPFTRKRPCMLVPGREEVVGSSLGLRKEAYKHFLQPVRKRHCSFQSHKPIPFFVKAFHCRSLSVCNFVLLVIGLCWPFWLHAFPCRPCAGCFFLSRAVNNAFWTPEEKSIVIGWGEKKTCF